MSEDWESQLQPGHGDDWEAQLSPGHDVTPAKPLDLGATATFVAHAAKHLGYGLGDKVIAGLQALDDVRRDKTGKVSFGDAYDRDLAFNDKALESSDEQHPLAHWSGTAAGVAGSVLAPAAALRGLNALRGVSAAAPVAKTLAQQAATSRLLGGVTGAVGAYGDDRSQSALGTAGNTALGGAMGTLIGQAAPYAVEGGGRALRYLGGKAQDAGGWLKVNSLHPTPTLGEAMEAIPGGRVGVGRELLERNLGGLTKHGTAEQIRGAAKTAGGDISRLATAYDAAGGAPLDLTTPIDASLVHAGELAADPLSRDAGNRLGGVASEYRQTYASPASAAEALALKRKVGDYAYRSAPAAAAGDTVAGDFGAGLGKLERGIDSSLDTTLGPEFERANVASRRLHAASDAADRTASRGHSNHLLGGLMTTMAGGAGFAHGGAGEAAPLALGSLLLSKYGAQAGARGLYDGGRAANWLAGNAAPYVNAGAVRAVTPAEERVAAIIQALRNRSQGMPASAVAQEDSSK